jgi:glycosyltransferase involved in cell wall biosynthesis
VSIVVPMFNEEANVEILYQQIAAVAARHELNVRIIFVDDSSTDRTAARVCAIVERDPRVCLVQLRIQSGQTAALAAGLETARSEILCTMDGDLQNDPADIPAMLALLATGPDMVVGWRADRKDAMLKRKVPSMIANRLIAGIMRLPIHDVGCGLKVFRAAMIRHVPLYGDLHRFLPAVALVAGSRIKEVKVNHRPRVYGVSKYSLSRTFEVLVDLVVVRVLTAFARQPIRVFSALALLPMLLGIAILVRVLWLMAGTREPPIMPLTATGLLLIVCASMLLLFGIAGELLMRFGNVRSSEIARATMHSLGHRSVASRLFG